MQNNKPVLTIDEAIAQYCPNAKTLREVCGDDLEKLEESCALMNCTPDDLMIGKAEMMTLVNFAPISASKKLEFRTILSRIEVK